MRIDEELDARQIAEGIAEWVRCESPSRANDALERMAGLIETQARALGLAVERLPVPTTTPALRITTRQPGDVRKGIMILGHYDTVHPVGTLESNPCRIEDGRLYGPGSYDMKAGAYLALVAMARVKDRSALPIDFLLLPDEEIGSRNSRALTEQQASERARYVLVCEPARANGGRCVTSRKGTAAVSVRTHGRPSHAGVAHEKGRSAIRELAHQILALESFTDYTAGITVNVGKIAGGTTGNVVPAEASAEVDVRIPDAKTAEALRARVERLKAHDPDVRLELEFKLNRPPMPRTEAQAAFFEAARQLAAKAGLALEEAPTTGGGSDGNFTAALGIPTLDGIGADGDGAHTLREHIQIDTLPLRLRVWETWLAELA